MALVKSFKRRQLERDARHKDVDATYSIVTDSTGCRLLQIDTYGSDERETPGKKSQSLRFSVEALHQLRELIRTEFPA